MATLIDIKNKKDHVQATLKLSDEEYLILGGYRTKIQILTDRVARQPSKISTRGADSSTKYFLIPLDCRDDLPIDTEVKCARLNLKNQIVFVYTVQKSSDAAAPAAAEVHEEEEESDN